MKSRLQRKIEIYQPNGIDWMNFILSRENPYTLHHIVEKRNGGSCSLDNLAILTKMAHKLLNIFDIWCPDAYDDLQEVFRKINESNGPPTDEIIREIDEILYKALISNEYKFYGNMDLDAYIKKYNEGRIVLQKRLGKEL